MLGLSVSGFTRLRISKVRFGRRAVRYRVSDIVEFINRRLVIQRTK